MHGETADRAIAGQRTALNLAGASTEDLSRGMTLVPPATLEKTRKADIELHLLASAARPLKNRAPVHLHSYTMETVAEIVLAGTRQIEPGERAFARLKLPEPALLLPGDRFILRQFSPVVTIGGGVVLDAAPIPRMLGQAEFLRVLALGNSESILRTRIARRGHNGITVSRLIAETGWTKNVIETQLADALKRAKFCELRSSSLMLSS